MKTQYLPCGVLRLVAGLAIGGAGFSHLFTHILSATEQLTRTLDRISGARTQLFSLIVIASSFNAHGLWPALLSVLWPMLPAFAGSMLLWSAAHAVQSNPQPCARNGFSSAGTLRHLLVRSRA
jgi:hypothetical protein